MDHELMIAYLDERFRETSQQIEGLRTEMDERFKEVNKQFKSVDEQFKSVDEQLKSVDEQFKSVNEQFKSVNQTVRQTLVIVEDLRDEIHLVAEAFLGTDERVTRLEKSEALTFETVKGMVEPYLKSIEERGHELDARSVQLDVPVKDLQNRVGVLEKRAARKGKKVMKAVAETVAGGKRSQRQTSTS